MPRADTARGRRADQRAFGNPGGWGIREIGIGTLEATSQIFGSEREVLDACDSNELIFIVKPPWDLGICARLTG